MKRGRREERGVPSPDRPTVLDRLFRAQPQRLDAEDVYTRIGDRLTHLDGEVRALTDRANGQARLIAELLQRIDALEGRADVHTRIHNTHTGVLRGIRGQLNALEARVGAQSPALDGLYAAQARLNVLGSTQAVPETSDSDTAPAPDPAWRKHVVLPHAVERRSSVNFLLRWLGQADTADDDGRRRLLGWIVALAERESGEPADPGAVDWGGGAEVLSVLDNVTYSKGINWDWVGDYCSGWLEALCKEKEA